MNTAKRTWSEDALVTGLCLGRPAVTGYYYHHLYRLACRRIVPPWAAWQGQILEDCFTTAFLILLDKLRAGACRPGKLDAFALAIVRLTFRDARRRARAGLLHPDTQRLLEARLYHHDPPAADGAAFFERYNRPAHLHWYENLSPRDRRLLDLRLQGYDQKDSAAALGLTHGTVRNVYGRLLAEAKGIK